MRKERPLASFLRRFQRIGTVEQSGVIGLALERDGIALCRIVVSEESPPVLQDCEFIACEASAREAVLSEAVERLGWAGQRCSCVITRDYTLRLAERPENVAASELREAARWLIRDFIDFDPSQAEIAVFDFPDSATRGRADKMYVVAARADAIREAEGLAEAAGLELESVTIPERAMLGIVDRLPEVVAGTAVLQLGEKGGVLALYHQQELYLVRGVQIRADELERALVDSSEAEGLSDEARAVVDSLILEVQRSIDYYESELGQAPASRLVLTPVTFDLQLMTPHAGELLRPMAVSVLDLGELLVCDTPLPAERQMHCLAAVGGALNALRGDPVSLARTAAAREEVSLTLPALVRLAAATVAAVAISHAAGLHFLSRQIELLESLEAEARIGQERIDAFRARYADASPDLDLRARVQQMRSEARTKQLLLTNLAGKEDAPPFSDRLVALARNPVEELWLDTVGIEQGGQQMRLGGGTTNPQRVASLLQSLRREAAFAGHGFGVLRMLASEEHDGVTRFSLYSGGDDQEVVEGEESG